MSLQPQPGSEIPPLTARVARASNPHGTTAMRIRNRLDGLWNDEDFTAWYPRDGRPGLSPAQLATVCVLRYVLNLSDRQAAEAVRCRIDFKYALGLELEDPGFHHSVLGVAPREQGWKPGPGGTVPVAAPDAGCGSRSSHCSPRSQCSSTTRRMRRAGWGMRGGAVPGVATPWSSATRCRDRSSRSLPWPRSGRVRWHPSSERQCNAGGEVQ